MLNAPISPEEQIRKWPKPGEVWSLWDMVNYVGVGVVLKIGEELSAAEVELYRESGLDPPENETPRTEVLNRLAWLCRMAGEHALSDQCHRLRDHYDISISTWDLVVSSVLETLNKKRFIALGPHSENYGSKDAYGESVTSSFPSSVYEIQDAGNCLATGHYTACVFHLMRALEPVLESLGREFGVTPASNWGTFLDRIETSIRDRENSKKRENWESEKEFYTDCVTHLIHIKNAWRNHTMHLRNRYDEIQAYEIFNDVKKFMQKISSKLKE